MSMVPNSSTTHLPVDSTEFVDKMPNPSQSLSTKVEVDKISHGSQVQVGLRVPGGKLAL